MREVCCVGSLTVDYFLVTNLSERWLQLSFSVCEVQCDGQPMGEEEGAVFSLPERSFVSPNQSEPIKVCAVERIKDTSHFVVCRE